MRRGNNTALAALGFAVVMVWGRAEGLFARGAAELVAEGNAAFEEGLLAEAIAFYEEARQAAPLSPVPLFNLGVVLYKQNNLPAALTAFQSIEESQEELAANIHYNQGNALARLGREAEDENPEVALELYRQSIAAYKRSLSIEPKHPDAAFNIEIVRYWIDELLDRTTPGSDESSGPRSSSSSPSQPNQQAPSQGENGEQDGTEEPAEQPPQAPDSPQTAVEEPWVPRDETAQAILREERERREAEARMRGGIFSNDSPTW